MIDGVGKIDSHSFLLKTLIYMMILAISLIVIDFVFGWEDMTSMLPFLQPYNDLILLIQPYTTYIQAVLLLIFGYMAVASVCALVFSHAIRMADRPTADTIKTITRVAGFAVALSTLSLVFNVNPAAALTMGSFGGLVIGFATQTILSHVIAGTFLLLSRPFKLGDTITVLGNTGVVKEVTLMHLIPETMEGEEILIPSGSVVTQVIRRKIAKQPA